MINNLPSEMRRAIKEFQNEKSPDDRGPEFYEKIVQDEAEIVEDAFRQQRLKRYKGGSHYTGDSVETPAEQ